MKNRHSEIRSLTRSSFDFTVAPATLFLAAKDAKNGQDATILLLEPLASDLAGHMRLHAPAAKAFRLQDGKGSNMLKDDSAAAGVPYVDDAGRYGDFHALRHCFSPTSWSLYPRRYAKKCPGGLIAA